MVSNVQHINIAILFAHAVSRKNSNCYLLLMLARREDAEISKKASFEVIHPYLTSFAFAPNSKNSIHCSLFQIKSKISPWQSPYTYPDHPTQKEQKKEKKRGKK